MKEQRSDWKDGVMLLDSAGRALPELSAPNGARVMECNASAVVSNASVAGATAEARRLTAYAVAHPGEDLMDLVNFVAPGVEAGYKFSYVETPVANTRAVVDTDGVGAGGLPSMVQFDARSRKESTLSLHGLETPLHMIDLDAASSAPGWSAAQERQERTVWLRDLVIRGIASRTIKALASAAGQATPLTWDEEADPIQDLHSRIGAIALDAGGRAKVHCLFGQTAWETLKFHPKLKGGADFPYALLNRDDVAGLLDIPASNIMVSDHQAVSSGQGVSPATMAPLLTTADVYLYGRQALPSRDDMSFMKRFVMKLHGAELWVYTYSNHPMTEVIGVAYYESIQTTNAAAVARLSVSTGE